MAAKGRGYSRVLNLEMQKACAFFKHTPSPECFRTRLDLVPRKLPPLLKQRWGGAHSLNGCRFALPSWHNAINLVQQRFRRERISTPMMRSRHRDHRVAHHGRFTVRAQTVSAKAVQGAVGVLASHRRLSRRRHSAWRSTAARFQEIIVPDGVNGRSWPALAGSSGQPGLSCEALMLSAHRVTFQMIGESAILSSRKQGAYVLGSRTSISGLPRTCPPR